jgi:flagellar protein FlaF
MYSKLNAYKSIEKPNISGREIEANVLIKAADMMENCGDNIGDAINFNLRVWTILQEDLIENGNKELPEELRQNLLALSNFVDKRTMEIKATGKRELMAFLIKLNRNIAAGLMT